jgi:acetamidase/formamidase
VIGPPFTYLYSAAPPVLTARPGERLRVFTEDAFGGRLTTTDGAPRVVAPFPRVNPLTGPIAVEGLKAGDVVAIHLASVTPARDWGVSTVSPNFGALSGTRYNPNFQAEQPELVWIWRVEGDAVVTHTASGGTLQAPLRPFHGCLGVAPPHGEARHSVVPDSFGGNLDISDVAAGATVYLRANVDGGLVHIGDGHYAQGDGELAGTAVEGAMNTELVFGALGPVDSIEWPRIETDQEIGVVGCARPLEDAARIASHGLILWVAGLCGLGLHDAHELVSQTCRLRVGNLVNPLYSVAAFVNKRWLPGAPVVCGRAHERLIGT